VRRQLGLVSGVLLHAFSAGAVSCPFHACGLLLLHAFVLCFQLVLCLQWMCTDLWFAAALCFCDLQVPPVPALVLEELAQ
jgi:hypothetical protein